MALIMLRSSPSFPQVSDLLRAVQFSTGRNESLTRGADRLSFDPTMGVRFVVRSREGKKAVSDVEFPFEQTRIVLGRGAAADVRIPHRTVSELHATVQLRGDAWMLADASSTNGTRHNGQRLQGDRPRRLREGDLIELGSYVLSFHTGVLVSEPISAERTAELARRLLRDAYGARSQVLEAPRLCVVSGPHLGDVLEIPPAPARLLVGGHTTCQLVLLTGDVEPEHVEIVHDLDGVLVRALYDYTLRLGDQSLRSRRLRDGDEFILGETRLLFEEPAQVAIDALKNEPDLVLAEPQSTTRTETETAPEPAAPEPPPVPPEPLSGAPIQAAVDGGRVDADVLIYALAAIVLIASTLGLMMLLGNS
jgi:pSer/pThr/pTyr-binding forkhead associated (FHA) protein